MFGYCLETGLLLGIMSLDYPTFVSCYRLALAAFLRFRSARETSFPIAIANLSPRDTVLICFLLSLIIYVGRVLVLKSPCPS